MARKKTPEPVQQELELAMPTASLVVKAVSRLEKLNKSVRSASGDMGEYVNKLVEDESFDKRALSIIRRLHSMPDEKFAITWPHVLHYAEALGFDTRASKQQEMFEEIEPPKPPTAKPAPEQPEKVTRLRPPQREAAAAQ